MEEHNYIRNETVKNDINNLSKVLIKKNVKI